MMEPSTYPGRGPLEPPDTRAVRARLKYRLTEESSRYHLKRSLMAALNEEDIVVANGAQTLFVFLLSDPKQREASCVVHTKMVDDAIKYLFKSSLCKSVVVVVVVIVDDIVIVIRPNFVLSLILD